MMALVGGGRWRGLLLGLVLLGCASGGKSPDTDSAGAGPSVSAAGGPAASNRCSIGYQCHCDNGNDGYYTQCEPTEACSCEGCPELKPDVAPVFHTCSGDVVGDWTLESADVKLASLDFPGDFGSLVTCPAQAVEVSRDLRLDLAISKYNRASRLYISGYSFSARFSDSCTQAYLRNSCGNGVTYDKRPCKLVGCQVCECPMPPKQALQYDALNVQAGNKILSLGTDTSTLVEFEYCADGDRLLLNDQHGLTATLRKVAFGGVPSACESRDESSCERGAFCKWGSNGCTGSSESSCQLQGFGIVPGCEVYEPDATCSPKAAPKTCAKLVEEDCRQTPGCEWQALCSGDSIDCNELWLRSGICDTDGGCTKVSTDVCTGTAECTKHTTQVRCQELNQCIWNGQCAVAKDEPCKDYSLTECTQHERCEIVGELAK